MALKSSAIIAAFLLVALVFYVIGFAVQDWDCDQGCVSETGGDHDTTWGTIITDYTVGVEAIVMATMAPGGGSVKNVIMASYILDSIGWLGGGLMHHAFAGDGEMHDGLWAIALLTVSLGGLVRMCAAIMSAKEAGKCRCMPSQKPLGIIACTAGLLFTVVLFLALAEHIPLPDWMVSAAKQVLMSLSLVMVGCVGGQPAWATAVFGCFALTVLNVVKFSPFKYSSNFNDNGLFHTGYILFLAAVFGLFNALVVGEEKGDCSEISDKSDVEI